MQFELKFDSLPKQDKPLVTVLTNTKNHLKDLINHCSYLETLCQIEMLKPREAAVSSTDLLNNYYLYSLKQEYCDDFSLLRILQKDAISQLGDKGAYITLSFSIVLQELYHSYDNNCISLQSIVESKDTDDEACFEIVAYSKNAMKEGIQSIDSIFTDNNL